MTKNPTFEIALSQIEGIGAVMFRQLINVFGSAENVFNANLAQLLKIPNLGKFTAAKIKTNSEVIKKAEDIFKNSEKNGIQTVVFNDQDYPLKLKSFFDAPPILYLKGKGSLEHQRNISIVGTRDASEYGKSMTGEIVKGLAANNVQIISGLAYGIDIASHKAAIKYNIPTSAVMATSLDKIYPAAHRKIANEITDTGLWISENPYGSTVVPAAFIARNRIIAALSEAVIIVESAKKGGSMVTAEFANNYNKEVFAVPGALNQKYSEGPNSLISDNKAQIFTGIAQFLNWMDWNESQPKIQKTKVEIDLSNFTLDESKVLSLLMHQKEMLIDDISWQSQIHLNKLASILLNLEFQDLIKQSPGKKFMLA